jgi:hypothetical protein
LTGDVVVVTEVIDGREDALRAHLRRLDAHTGPLATIGRATHFARFVVLPLDGHKLYFSSRFDGEPRPYLEALAGQVAARSIWAFCDPAAAANADRLLTYLEAHRIPTPYAVAAWTETVEQVNAAVRRRAQLQRLARRAATLDPVGLAHAFREEFRR